MAFCKNCGKQLSDGAKFCAECGAPTGQTSASTGGKRTSFEGEIRKCPNCGEVLKAFETVCPSCKYELRGIQSSAVVTTLTNKLEQATSERQQITIIQNFPIPNTKEDIYELFLVACSNFDENLYTKSLDREDITDAWYSLIKRCYEKAKVSFGKLTEFTYIEEQYSQLNAQISKDVVRLRNKEKLKKNKGLIITASVLVFVLVVGIILTCVLLTPPKPIEIGCSEADFVGENYWYVYDYLVDKGYENIKKKEIKVTTSQSVDEMVLSVTIDGRSDFVSTDTFDKSALIVIEYNVKSKICIGKKAGDLKGKNYEEVIEYLENLGFTNITTEEQSGTLVDDIFFQNDDVYKISIEATDNFKAESSFYSDVSIVITIYKT